MNENLKTLTFVIVAAAVGLAAWASKPSLPSSAVEEFRNQLLNPDFNNPLDAASLEIVKYDEAKGALIPFKVAVVAYKGKIRWSIPSHEDYPADAKNQMASAGAALVGLRIIDKVSDDEGDQETYGVVDPDPKALKLGASGVGERVVMRDKAGKELLALVVGKQVKDQPDRPDLHYVRKVGDSAIYIVEAKTDKLSTKFEDWIEPNLLQINTMDLKDLLIRDYAIRATSRGMGIEYRGKMEIAYNDAAEPKWTMPNDEKFVFGSEKDSQGRWERIKMAADEELNATKLDELKTALDDLKIVNVSRKPAGLSADLKVAKDFISSQETVDSLEEKGFYAVPVGENGPIELFSNEGEIRVVMKSGVVYVLRFGQITGDSSTAKDTKKKDKAKDGKKDKDKKPTGLNRYLFVVAEFDPDAIPKPQMEQYVEPAKAKEPEKKPGEKKADEKKPEPKKQTEADKKAEQAERARIEKENKRKQEEYNQQIVDCKKKAAELNLRFADWYYVISDEVYRKIHLSRSEIVVKKPKKEPAKGAEGADAGRGVRDLPVDINVPGPSAKELEKAKNAVPSGKK
jgi:hypothetical protein